MSTVSEPHAKDRDATFAWRAAGSQRCWQGTIFLRQAKFTGPHHLFVLSRPG
jgi:hypothetical protein